MNPLHEDAAHIEAYVWGASLLLREMGGIVHRVRLARDLSLRDVAKETGLDAPTLSRIERGLVVPQDDELAALLTWIRDE